MSDEQEQTAEVKPEVNGNGKNSKLAVIFQKQGHFSITRTILIVAWSMVLFKYFFAGITLDFTIAGEAIKSAHNWKVAWNIAFDSGDAISILGAASTLYFANHNISYKK